MRTRHFLVLMALASIVLGSAATRAQVERSSVEVRPSAPSQSSGQAGKGRDAPPADDASPTRDQILKEGPVALEQNCLQCHGPDKWEGTNRDREGWNATVREMSRQMVEAQLPRMSERTTNVIVGYLTLTRPQ